MVAAGFFTLGMVVAFLADLWLRARWLYGAASRCSTPGCGREGVCAVMVVERDGLMRMLKFWGVCSWCAHSAELYTHGLPSDRSIT